MHTTKAINGALQLALDNDIIITVATGNGKDSPHDLYRSINYDSCKVYPAGYPGVINIGATDMHDNALMGEFDNETIIANMGKCGDVFAPGYKILCSDICPLGHCNNDSEECIAGMMYNNTCRKFWLYYMHYDYKTVHIHACITLILYQYFSCHQLYIDYMHCYVVWSIY